MAMRFWWRPNNSPVASASTDRVNIGLELGGNLPARTIPTSGSGTPGRVRLYEIGGSGTHRGSAETRQQRLIATFHGNFHQDARAKPWCRITFELNGYNASGIRAHDQLVLGFDPECIVGVDSLVLTFVNREFQVNLPFYVDTRSEGRFLEILAVAETGNIQSPNVISRRSGAILNLRIRRVHNITTTSGSKAYNGHLIGNIIAHHERYLVGGAVRNRNTRPPWPRSGSIIELTWSGTGRIPFQNYTAGSLEIILKNEVVTSLLPSATYIQTNVRGVSNGQQARVQMQTRLRTRIRNSLNTIFTNAGFTRPNTHWENEPGAAAAMAAFNGAFSGSGRNLSLRPGHTSLATPFWRFYVFENSNLGPVGLSEDLDISLSTPANLTGNREYLLGYPAPIGSGNKLLTRPIFIRPTYFLPKLTRDISKTGRTIPRTYTSQAAFNTAVDVMASKMAILIAHEIGHSLGMMHETQVLTSGHYPESGADHIMSIMASGIDSASYGMGMMFSHQAKVIWHRAFGVTPTWTNTFLRNKTWGNNWATTDWDTRKRLFRQRHYESALVFLDLRHGGTPPPFAKTGSSVQRGTYR